MVEISQFVCAVYSLKNCLWVQGGYLLVLGGYLGGWIGKSGNWVVQMDGKVGPESRAQNFW